MAVIDDEVVIKGRVIGETLVVVEDMEGVNPVAGTGNRVPRGRGVVSCSVGSSNGRDRGSRSAIPSCLAAANKLAAEGGFRASLTDLRRARSRRSCC